METQTAGNIFIKLLIFYPWELLLMEKFYVSMEECLQIFQQLIKWDCLIESNRFLMKDL